MEASLTTAAVRPATGSESAALSDVLARAFFDDPVFAWMMPAPARRHGRLRRFFAIELDAIVFPKGDVWTTASHDGAALCLPPGEWRMPASVTLVHGPAYTRVFATRLPHSLAVLSQMERRHYREPHYYIAYVGVRPELQGRGIGTELLRPILERCDREELPAYLEASCERNAALYERLGFERGQEFSVLGSPPLLPMLRAPATSGVAG
jgi:GNAT superfamily N-acetyltransferase